MRTTRHASLRASSTLGVALAYLLVLAAAFWRNAPDPDKHRRAGAELVDHVLAKQGHSGDTSTFEVVTRRP